MIDIAARLAEYRGQLDAAGLGRYADALSDAALPSIRLLADAQIHAAIAGVSRLGGFPDLPAGLPWPVNDDGAPLSFIAQLDLGEMAAHDVEGILPRTGLLSFFYEAATQSAWGYAPADHGAWAVMHTAGGMAVEPREVPDSVPAEGRFPAVGISPQLELTFAPWESFLVERLGMTREEGFAYADMLPTGVRRPIGCSATRTRCKATCSSNASSSRTASTAGTSAGTGIRALRDWRQARLTGACFSRSIPRTRPE